MKEQQNNNDVIQSPTIESHEGESSVNNNIDLSPISQQLGEIINIIQSELDAKKKKEQEDQKKKEEDQQILQSELATQEEKEELFWTGYNTLVTNSNILTTQNENIIKQNDELIFLDKLGFVGLGVGIALVSVLIFQNAFKK